VANPSIAFIGAGNMAASIIGGLVAKQFQCASIIASDPSAAALERLQATIPSLEITTDNNEAINRADVVVLAVKPQVMKTVAESIKPVIQSRQPLVISIAAGIEIGHLAKWLGDEVAIIRCMPNTPALVQRGATGLFANQHVSEQQKKIADNILSAIGISLWVDSEAQLDAVTAVSGSGPAYFFLVMEAMQAAGKKLGLSTEVANQLTLQTALGAAEMAIASDVDAAELRRRVTSPGGTTEQAIKTFEEGGLRELFDKALNAAHHRSEELARLMDKE
jgi:pyrroline-5-carboxylate reductase